jgi:hypothetical protein
MTESKFKKRIMTFMILSKLFIMLEILFYTYNGGFSKGEALSVISFILPLFMVYITAMVKNTASEPYIEVKQAKGKNMERKIKPNFKTMTYLIFPIYLLAIFLIIRAKPMQFFTITDMQAAIGIVESGLGVYIGIIVFSLFKPAETESKER